MCCWHLSFSSTQESYSVVKEWKGEDMSIRILVSNVYSYYVARKQNVCLTLWLQYMHRNQTATLNLPWRGLTFMTSTFEERGDKSRHCNIIMLVSNSVLLGPPEPLPIWGWTETCLMKAPTHKRSLLHGLMQTPLIPEQDNNSSCTLLTKEYRVLLT